MSPSSAPFLSIAVATHNRPVLLSATLASIARQDCPDFEVVVVDDGSTPPVNLGSIPEAAGLAVRLVRHDKALGGCAAKNAAVSAAVGRFVAFVDDDDLIAPTFVRRHIEIFTAESDLDVVFGAVEALGANAEMTQRGADAGLAEILACVGGESGTRLTRLDRRVVPALLRSVPIAFQRPAFRRHVFDGDLGGFRPAKTIWECEWSVRAVCLRSTAVLSERLHVWRVDGQGYFTDERKALDVAEAGVVIHQRLFDDRWTLGKNAEERRAFRSALAEAWFILSYQLADHPSRQRAAWNAWWQSVKTELSWRRTRFLWRLLSRWRPFAGHDTG